MNKQAEFENLPEQSELEKKAIEFLNRKTDVESAQRILGEAKLELIDMFISKGKSKIKVEGFTVSYRHQEKDVVSSRQAKEA